LAVHASGAGISRMSLTIFPEWPAEYLAEIASRTRGNHRAPVLVGPGILLPPRSAEVAPASGGTIAQVAGVPQVMLFENYAASSHAASQAHRKSPPPLF